MRGYRKGAMGAVALGREVSCGLYDLEWLWRFRRECFLPEAFDEIKILLTSD